MRLASVNPGDRVLCEVRGWKFSARVKLLNSPEIPGKPVRIEPEVSNCTFYHLAARQVKAVLPEPIEEAA